MAFQRFEWRAIAKALWGELPGPFGPIERDLGPAFAVVWAVYETTLRDALVMNWTLSEATQEVAARLQVVSLGQAEAQR